jgi:hypothetical protein
MQISRRDFIKLSVLGIGSTVVGIEALRRLGIIDALLGADQLKDIIISNCESVRMNRPDLAPHIDAVKSLFPYQQPQDTILFLPNPTDTEGIQMSFKQYKMQSEVSKGKGNSGLAPISLQLQRASHTNPVAITENVTTAGLVPMLWRLNNSPVMPFFPLLDSTTLATQLPDDMRNFYMSQIPTVNTQNINVPTFLPFTQLDIDNDRSMTALYVPTTVLGGIDGFAFNKMQFQETSLQWGNVD